MNGIQLIEVKVETHLQDDAYYKYYTTHIFSTIENYSHKELVNIMANINQKYVEDENICVSEIDFQDLSRQLSEHKIYEVLPFERYYFDIEEED